MGFAAESVPASPLIASRHYQLQGIRRTSPVGGVLIGGVLGLQQASEVQIVRGVLVPVYVGV